MPEGDSLRRAAARLQVLVGTRVAAESPHPQGLATGVARAVDGRVLEGVEAVGKHLLLRFEGGVVVRSHLRMSGRWRVGRRGATVRGRPWLVLRAGEWEAAQWNGPVLTLDAGPARRLGPDLLSDETDVGDVAERLHALAPDRLVGEALLDQRLLAGLGNMWLAEALWHARLSPWRRVGEVAPEELVRALAWARDAMLASVAGARPRPGRVQPHRVLVPALPAGRRRGRGGGGGI
ncbi:MAG TPA: DNA-formamidopyrimidine glycosylase family protein [Gaiellaceae bacterium]|nr:DNA-formamidopyrimidine glycosylase family protein [Gaiellaceae bacterium]